MMLPVLILCQVSCTGSDDIAGSDIDDSFAVRWEIGTCNDHTPSEGMSVLIDTKEQIIGREITILIDDEIKTFSESTHFVLDENQFRELYSLLNDRTMIRRLNDGGHYYYDQVCPMPGTAYRLTVYSNDSQKCFTYDDSICAATDNDLSDLVHLHKFLVDAVMNSEDWISLLSEYNGYYSPFD